MIIQTSIHRESSFDIPSTKSEDLEAVTKAVANFVSPLFKLGLLESVSLKIRGDTTLLLEAVNDEVPPDDKLSDATQQGR